MWQPSHYTMQHVQPLLNYNLQTLVKLPCPRYSEAPVIGPPCVHVRPPQNMVSVLRISVPRNRDAAMFSMSKRIDVRARKLKKVFNDGCDFQPKCGWRILGLCTVYTVHMKLLSPACVSCQTVLIRSRDSQTGDPAPNDPLP